ncbi:hypothetical protein BKA65DRAFT_571569 [Rhexocercosporidium sp. MPI-PUGE-AT-0058]|nr:hypothetical protein BKA65DRAFT_571569 [Rhexocercosporidium sp. MPI-PUGE-AT-0058]
MRPGFESCASEMDQKPRISNAIAPSGSLEEGEIIESYLPFDYTSIDRPKIPTPSVAHSDSRSARNDDRSKAIFNHTKLFAKGTIRFDSVIPPVQRKRSRPRPDSQPYNPSDIPSDIEMDDTIVVDCPSLLSRVIPAPHIEAEEPSLAPPRKKRLVRRSELKNARVGTVADDDSVESVAMKAVMQAATTRPRKPTEKALRYATEEEMTQLTASIENAQFVARTEGSYDKPDSYEECAPESNWQPYKCFVCQQKRSINSDISKHLESRHSIILPRKFKAWQYFFPECPKGFCDRLGALKHAKSHFKNV